MARSSGYLISHLSQTGSQSPFVVAGCLITDAISKLAAAQGQVLGLEIMGILKEIYVYFDSIIDNEAKDPSEQPVRSALKEYLKKAAVEFAELQAELKKIKQRYEAVEIKQED